jgi:hypothetical protein
MAWLVFCASVIVLFPSKEPLFSLGFNEALFSLVVGHLSQDRRVCAWDFINRVLASSQQWKFFTILNLAFCVICFVFYDESDIDTVLLRVRDVLLY